MKKRFFSIISIIFFGILTFSGCKENQHPIIGAKIYEYDGDPLVLIAKWKAVGINTAFISKELSRNETFTDKLREFDIPFYIIWPVFQNDNALDRDSSLYAILDNGRKAKDDWVKFVCPSRNEYRKTQLDSIAWYAKNIQPAGMSIDFIRQFVYWEMVYPDRHSDSIHTACYCDSCYLQFLAKNTIHAPDSLYSVPDRSSYLNTYYQKEWDQFRCGLITCMVKDIHEIVKKINPGIMINLHIVPWRNDDFDGAITHVAAQSIPDLAPYADYISPMCYSQMLKRNSAWIADVVKDLNYKAPGKVLSSIQVYPFYVDAPFPPDSLRSCLRESLKAPSNGVVFWSWPLLEKDPARIRVVMDEI